MITIDQYTTIKIEEYKGIYSLQEGRIDNEGNYKPNFIKRRFGRSGEEKTIPLSVRLGNKETALNALAKLVLEIDPAADDIPF